MLQASEALAPPVHRAVAVGALSVAIAAWVGAAGLMLGFTSLPPALEARLPLDSPVLGGAALALVVALPYSLLGLWTWRHDSRWRIESTVCGLILLSWIAIELAFLREVSFLHPLCVIVGAGFVWAPRRR